MVGAGAWGLPAAAELARRGHEVMLVDRYGIANLLSSSPGPSRMWRLTHSDRIRVRLARRSVEAMERLAVDSGRAVFLRRGLLWRDDPTPLEAVAAALSDEGVEFEAVPASGVAKCFPGLRPDGRPALWQRDAGPVLAAASLAAQAELYQAAGGVTVIGRDVTEVDVCDGYVRLRNADGTVLDADRVVLAAGPGTGRLLSRLGVDLTLRPRLEQVVHLDGPAAGTLPCLYDAPSADQVGMYALPTPGVGYKVGLEERRRYLQDGDLDRTPDPDLTALAVQRVQRDLTALNTNVVDAQVCCWTDSPDDRFVIDTLPGGIVLACGDSGQGFKFSALMGLVLADLAEDNPPDPDIATFRLARFAPADWAAGTFRQ